MLLTIIQLIRLLRGFGSCSSPLPKVERVKRSGTHTKSSQLLFMQLNEVVFEHHVHGVILQKIIGKGYQVCKKHISVKKTTETNDYC